MNARKVIVGKTYIYDPVLIDRCDSKTDLKRGDLVRVINVRGCPPANTMGHCYVERNGKFMGLVCTNSLKEVTISI